MPLDSICDLIVLSDALLTLEIKTAASSPPSSFHRRDNKQRCIDFKKLFCLLMARTLVAEVSRTAGNKQRTEEGDLWVCQYFQTVGENRALAIAPKIKLEQI